MKSAYRSKWRVLFCALLLLGCGASGSEDEAAPAHVENPTTEAELTTIRLTPQAEQRIGIEVGAVESRRLERRRTLGGELIVPPGAAVTVTAPRAATVLEPETGRLPTAGSWVAKGQALVRLVILPGGGELARAQEEVTVADARVENARAKARRAEQLLRDGVGTAAELEDAQAELASAEAVQRAARARLELLQTGRTDLDVEDLSPITLQAPESGIVQSVYFAAGQTVSDGAPLMEIVKPNPLWVRVPVYVGDAASIDRTAPATVAGPGDPPDAPRQAAVPIRGPSTANPSAASVDLFYRLENPEGRYRPGQRVGVSVRSEGAVERVVVPWSAVLLDIYGGTWVYEALGDHVYARRRVEVRDVVEDIAVLGRGLEPSTPIVVIGAAELFSTEFGTSH